uniref:Type-1 angiotensin II receptor n=1 Tax=Leptobrachium leishanense TaxID=445787 RepID=A0A8C5QFT8_9ANUR
MTPNSPFQNISSNLSTIRSHRVSCLVLTDDFAFVFLLVPIFHIIIFIVGVIGNTIIILGLTCCIQNKTVANVYIVNLAIADLFFVATLPLWAVNVAEKYKWTFGSFMCKVCASMSSLNMYASIFLLTCLSIDRFHAIVHPVKSLSRRTPTRAKISAAIVWLSAVAATSPTMYFRQTYKSELRHYTVCSMKYPQNSIFWMTFVELMKNIVGFLIPFILQGICYILIYKKMLSPKNKGKREKSDKVLKIVMAMAFAFVICWLPFHIANLLNLLIRLNIITTCATVRIIKAITPITICIAFSNSCVNPILYYFASKRFRNQFVNALRRSYNNSYISNTSTKTLE